MSQRLDSSRKLERYESTGMIGLFETKEQITLLRKLICRSGILWGWLCLDRRDYIPFEPAGVINLKEAFLVLERGQGVVFLSSGKTCGWACERLPSDEPHGGTPFGTFYEKWLRPR
jgi:hypothetical protein